jgi:hypothetical protein
LRASLIRPLRLHIAEEPGAGLHDGRGHGARDRRQAAIDGRTMAGDEHRAVERRGGVGEGQGVGEDDVADPVRPVVDRDDPQ